MATDQHIATKTETDGCITLERWRWLRQTREAAVVVFVGGSDPTRQTVAAAVTAGAIGLIQTETDTHTQRQRHRRLH